MFDSTEPFLPFDVIEYIVDIYIEDLDNADYLQNVKALSLTGPLFLHLCRSHMFYSIDIIITNSSHYSDTTEAFGELLSTTPEIARYIRDLKIYIAEPNIKSTHFFSQVPQQLTALLSLRVSNSDLDWNLVSSSMQRSILDLMHLPTLRYLCVGRMENFLVSNLIPCSNLRRLFVRQFSTVSEDADADDGTASSLCHKPLQFRMFHLHTKSLQDLSLLEAKFSDGRPILDFTVMERLFINFDWPGAAVPLREIFKRSRELRDIHLEVNHTSFRALEFATAIAPCLETLRRVCLDIIARETPNDPLVGLCDELEDISGKNILESIELEITLLIDEDHPLSDDWARLENILLKPGWPMLKRVFLIIGIHADFWDGYARAMANLLRAHFTGLKSSKTFDFQLSVQEEWRLFM
ncbi:hypothetical protein BYT27DRAFT_7340066 [Phlegmacium glaucopus]|nr:hypothetical protein BYT27DRAFT_7340066 [Phlegmacium glaucopus]